MKEKLANFLFSTRLMAILFIAFAVAMGVGTFLDAQQETSPTAYSRTLIYNSWWFEAIMILFVVNFCGNIFRYRLIQQKKWSVLVLHLSFILIIVGAGVTRYIGYEGVMPIIEGQSTNKMLTDKTYLSVWIDGEVNGEEKRRKLEKSLLLSERLKDGAIYNNNFTIDTDFKNNPVTITYSDFKNGVEEVTRFHYDNNSDEYLHFVESGGGHREDHYIKAGTTLNIHNILVSYERPEQEGGISIFKENDSLKIRTPFEGSRMVMRTQEEFLIQKDSVQPFNLLSLHQLGGLSFVVPENPMRGEPKKEYLQTTTANADLLTVKVTANGITEEVQLLGGKGTVNPMKDVQLGDLKVHLAYGSKEIDLPFSVQLNDLIAEKYPGADPNSFGAGFKSYESQVTVTENDKTPFDARIYMNNVLDHGGYRFFQASINFSNDERKVNNDPDITVLSVNHDRWGTWITYAGYFMLYLGLMLILFDKNTRFGNLKGFLKKIDKKKKEIMLPVFLLLGIMANAQQEHVKLPKQEVDSILKARAFPKEEAAKFGHLLIQDFNGRFKPANTYASELLRKVSKSDTYEGLDANQVLLSIIQNNTLWYDVPVIKLKRGNDSIRKMLNLDVKEKYAAISDFYTAKGVLKIPENVLMDATNTNTPNQFQKDIKRAYQDQRLLLQAIAGSLIRIYPVPGDDNNKWVSSLELGDIEYGPKKESDLIKRLFPQAYFSSLIAGEYDKAEEVLELIERVQRTYSDEVMPTKEKIEAEVKYNRYDIFKKLFSWYMYAGVLMLIFLIVQIFYPTKFVGVSVKVFKAIIFLLFLLHLGGLIARWYISGHAPWSDAYESMIFIGFSTVLFGILFARKSDMAVAATAFVTSMILMIAHWNWMDPAIANLEPVLDSYWLMIHVAVIVGSYGPFTLAWILGIIGLFLILFTNKENKVKIKLNLDEITYVTEMAITIGLVMLTIGNFLGGQWANESWGRYWGWDPKETWALISIMVYAFVLHARLVPGLRGRWTFNFLASFAFKSILMTYFGVNFYLVGLHSYASGDLPVTPTFVWVYVSLFLALAVASWFSYKKHYAK